MEFGESCQEACVREFLEGGFFVFSKFVRNKIGRAHV